MASQLCETCRYKNDWSCYCSPNSCCTDYEYEGDMTKEDKMEDAMIRAANKAVITSHQLLDVLMQQGLMGVYNLGLKHMYEYLVKGD